MEKELRTKETMKMMGLRNWILTATWFLNELIFLFVPILIVAVLLKVFTICSSVKQCNCLFLNFLLSLYLSLFLTLIQYGMIYSLSNLFLPLLFLWSLSQQELPSAFSSGDSQLLYVHVYDTFYYLAVYLIANHKYMYIVHTCICPVCIT